MKVMTHRTTFALDQQTSRRLRRLSRLWRVSQAEVVRRAVASAGEEADDHTDPVALLRELLDSGKGLSADQANAYMIDIAEHRKCWRG